MFHLKGLFESWTIVFTIEIPDKTNKRTQISPIPNDVIICYFSPRPALFWKGLYFLFCACEMAVKSVGPKNWKICQISQQSDVHKQTNGNNPTFKKLIFLLIILSLFRDGWTKRILYWRQYQFFFFFQKWEGFLRCLVFDF